MRQLDKLSCPAVIHSSDKCQEIDEMDGWRGMKKSQTFRLMDRETKEHLLRWREPRPTLIHKGNSLLFPLFISSFFYLPLPFPLLFILLHSLYYFITFPFNIFSAHSFPSPLSLSFSSILFHLFSSSVPLFIFLIWPLPCLFSLYLHTFFFLIPLNMSLALHSFMTFFHFKSRYFPHVLLLSHSPFSS